MTALSRTVSEFIEIWSAGLSSDEQDTLVAPLLPLRESVPTTDDVEVEQQRLATDWLVWCYLPPWLRLIALDDIADELAGLEEVLDFGPPFPRQTLELAVRQADALMRAERERLGDVNRPGFPGGSNS